jgi:hypothetical protein
MKAYVKLTPEGLIALNSDNATDQTNHANDSNTREFTSEEYALFGDQIKYVGNENTKVTGTSLDDATVSYTVYTATQLFNAAIEILRDKRNTLLDKSEWTVNNDNQLSDEKKAEWKTYRQKLRDITKDLTTEAEVNAVSFPTQPS